MQNKTDEQDRNGMVKHGKGGNNKAKPFWFMYSLRPY